MKIVKDRDYCETHQLYFVRKLASHQLKLMSTWCSYSEKNEYSLIRTYATTRFTHWNTQCVRIESMKITSMEPFVQGYDKKNTI